MKTIAENPFRVHTPESLSAEEVVKLYVSEMPGADAVHSAGDTMVVGSRGTGKSMMLRYLEPDCQLLVQDHKSQVRITDIDYYALYVTIKQTDLIYPELESLEGTFADRPVNEHFLILILVWKAVSRCIDQGTLDFAKKNTLDTENSKLFKLLNNFVDYDGQKPKTDFDLFLSLVDYLADLHAASLQYLDEILADPDTTPKFETVLLRFSTFLLPFLEAWVGLEGMPRTQRLFIIIDDADYLNEMQTKILNTYVSTRQSYIFFKIASEIYQYKTFSTLDGRRIEVPHDFAEINTVDIYTSNTTRGYEARLTRIIDKRLELYNFDKSKTGRIANAEQFFPEDGKQKSEISKLRREISTGAHKVTSGASRPRDNAYRYAIPEYIRLLGGEKKSRSNYSYSGYNQLVNISSGIPRYFLEAAYLMYDRMKALHDGEFTFIDPSVQNTVVREQAERIVMEELERLKLSDTHLDGSSATAVLMHNLIISLGSFFQVSLLDTQATERRYFSFALSQTPTPDLEKVLRFGVRNSMFTRTTIGRKEGFGRTHRYILTRRVAPYFTLDPNGFTAYKFLTNSALERMMHDPDGFRQELRRKTADGGIGPLFDGLEDQ
jgi:hypothetical protein